MANSDLFKSKFPERIQLAKQKAHKHISGRLEDISSTDETLIGMFLLAAFGDYVSDDNKDNPEFEDFVKFGNFMMGESDGFLCLVFIGSESDGTHLYACYNFADKGVTDSCIAWLKEQWEELNAEAADNVISG